MSLDISIYMGDEEVFTANITHNLNTMAKECGLYDAMWRPYRLHKDFVSEELDIYVGDVKDQLSKGLVELAFNPNKYAKFNPDNGWGSYSGLKRTATSYLEACELFPEGRIVVDR